jgi:hypothetical protein
LTRLEKIPKNEPERAKRILEHPTMRWLKRFHCAHEWSHPARIQGTRTFARFCNLCGSEGAATLPEEYD